MLQNLALKRQGSSPWLKERRKPTKQVLAGEWEQLKLHQYKQKSLEKFGITVDDVDVQFPLGIDNLQLFLLLVKYKIQNVHAQQATYQIQVPDGYPNDNILPVVNGEALTSPYAANSAPDLKTLLDYLVQLTLAREEAKWDKMEESSQKCAFVVDPTPLMEGKIIGRGCSGVVRKAKYKNVDIAVKTYLYKQDKSDLLDLLEQAKLLCTLKHPKLLTYFGYFVVKEKCYLKLLMECAEGTLHDLMYKQKQLLKYEQILRIALDVALGLQALHQQRILHRHLKASHVMIMKDGSAKLNIDLNHLLVLAPGQEDVPGPAIGLPYYFSPEEFATQGTYNQMVDIYAFGVLLNEMFKQKRPWSDIDSSKIAHFVMQGERELIGECPKDVAACIRACWSAIPQKRPHISEIVKFLASKLPS